MNEPITEDGRVPERRTQQEYTATAELVHKATSAVFAFEKDCVAVMFAPRQTEAEWYPTSSCLVDTESNLRQLSRESGREMLKDLPGAVQLAQQGAQLEENLLKAVEFPQRFTGIARNSHRSELYKRLGCDVGEMGWPGSLSSGLMRLKIDGVDYSTQEGSPFVLTVRIKYGEFVDDLVLRLEDRKKFEQTEAIQREQGAQKAKNIAVAEKTMREQWKKEAGRWGF